MADRRVLDQLTHLLHNRPNLSAEGGDALYQQFAQPIFDRRQENRDEEEALAMAEEQERKARLADLQNMLLGSALDEGTLAPQQVRQTAQSFGAAPQQARQMAQMVAPTPQAQAGLDPEDAAELATYVAMASQGISPRQAVAGASPDPAAPMPAVPTDQVIQEVRSLMLASGATPQAIAQAEMQIRAGYRTGP